MTKTRALVVSLGLLIALSGCAQEPPTTLPSNSLETAAPSATATPTSTPTPTPTSARPALHDLTLTTEGLDDLVPGEPITGAAPDEAIVVFDENACPESASSPAGAGRWVSTFAGGDQESFYLMVGNEELYRIVVTSPLILTDRGVGVGVDESVMKQAYPEARIGSRDDESVTLFVVDGARGNLTFEISRDTSSAQFGTVTFMTLMRSDVEPWAISNTGAGATCGH